MKFDVIIGNPPYNANNKAKKKLWPKFITVAFNANPSHIIFITPTAWAYGESSETTPVRNKLKDGLVFADLCCSRYFPDIGDDISAWYWSSIYKGMTNVIAKGGDYYQHDFSFRFIKKEDQLFVDIERKVFSHKDKIEIRAFNEPKNNLKESGKFKVQYSASQVLFTDIQPSDYFHPKVFINKSGHYWTSKDPSKYIHYMDEGISGGLAYYILVNNKKEGDHLVSLLQSKLYVFLMQFNPTKNIQFKVDVNKLPIMDLSKSWSDKDLYQYFELTQEEIDYIEAIVK